MLPLGKESQALSPELARADTAPLSDLPLTVGAYLREAMKGMEKASRVDGHPREILLARAKEQARVATIASNEQPSEIGRVDALSRANADVAAAASLGIQAFPAEVSVDGLIGVANLSVSLGRTSQISGDVDQALDLYMLGLDLVRVYRAYTRVASVDQITYTVASRAASAAGELAAERYLPLANALDALDRNIVQPYSTLMKSEDLSAPRAFGVVALLRRALVLGNPDYLVHLRADIVPLLDSLVPDTPAARIRFEADMAALLSEVDVRLGKRKRGAFEW